MTTRTHDRASRSPADELAGLLADELVDELAHGLVADIEHYLAARKRTAHPLVTATTDELVREALATLPTGPAARPETGAVLPGGIWRILPDRLLALHPARRGEGVQRLRITVAEHLELTALVLERWGWAKTGRRTRTTGGAVCVLGAQKTLYRLGYGSQDTAVEAGRHIQNTLTARGIREPFWVWNDALTTNRDQVLAVVRDAATGARGGR
ncbi:hypothetical protein ACIO6U_28205 [Streptomyces sp. NPDC087422]|uniref:DUF6197 family protein n=1 Tax=Streptomyces sp. NPDC087422 TaxID=3365786 RepID=UPI003816D9E7